MRNRERGGVQEAVVTRAQCVREIFLFFYGYVHINFFFFNIYYALTRRNEFLTLDPNIRNDILWIRLSEQTLHHQVALVREKKFVFIKNSSKNRFTLCRIEFQKINVKIRSH